MSHHFDTKLAKEDPSLNLCDFYLFDGPLGQDGNGDDRESGCGIIGSGYASSRRALRITVRPGRRCEGRSYVQVQVW